MGSYDEIWSMVTEEMLSEFSQTSITLWFSNIKPVVLNDKVAVFIAKNNFYRDILVSKYKATIAKYLKEVLAFDVEVVILSDDDKPIDISPYTHSDTPEYVGFDQDEASEQMNYEQPTEEKKEENHKKTLEELSNHSQLPKTLTDNYTFENFIVGSSNKFAHAASLAVANSPQDNEYNPLFIYGESGLGKTHLLYAIMNKIRLTKPDLKILYVKGEDFTNKLIECLTKKNTSEFRNTFRTVNVLLIDDVQFIAGKEATQEEFFHTFNSLYEDGKQIILVSDKPPSEIKTLENRLRSRFESGLIADIQKPNLELRIAIMKDKADKKGVNISYEILYYLAENLTDSVRQLEGAINKICAQAFLINSPIDIEMAKKAVSDMISDKPSAEISTDKIISVVGSRFGVSEEDLKSKKRNEPIASVRHRAIYLIHKLTDKNYVEIGKIFKRDRTTIMSSVRTVEDERKINSTYEYEINELIKELKGK